MTRSWMGSLVVSLGWLAAAAPAGEVVASAPRPPGAQAGRPVSAVAIGLPPRAPVATLGRPRAARAAAPDVFSKDPGLLPVGYREPGGPRPSPYQPMVPSPDAVAAEEEPTTFAIERVAYFEGAPPDAPGPVLGPVGVEGGPADGFYGEAGYMGYADGMGGPPARLYASAEYLAWWTKDAGVPPLVTTSANVADFGILGRPTTRILFGGPLDHEMQHGARFRAGYWLDTCKPIAVEAGYFFLRPRSDRFFADSSMFPVIARPFFDLNNGVESAQLVSAPTISTGMIAVDAPSRLLGYEFNLRCPVCCGVTCDGGFNVDLLGGFRHVRLDEGLYITEVGLNAPTAPVDPGQAFRIDDRFDTMNRFYGGQVGLAGELRRGRLSLGVRSTLALGWTRQVLNINGGAVFVNPNGTVEREVGGLLALPSNIGRFSQDRFAVIPEVGLTVGYQLTDALRVTGGWNFLYWSSVLRPGDQIDRGLDITMIPGDFAPPGTRPTALNRPAPLLREKDFWAQGFSLGAEFRW